MSMELVLRTGGAGEREERASVRRDADGSFEVKVGERFYRVDVARAGAVVRSLLIDGQQHEVAVREESPGRYAVSAGGALHSVEATDPLTFLARQSHADKGARGAHTVRAYMPGRVVELLVGVGDEVAVGQGLLVLEAMKMQNEIQAERPGRVRLFHVAVGEAVEGGDPLVDLE
jgi:pyruvate carboxylase subunit B